ncbi:MAG TPA: GH25 family lysozyme [Candidatus Sulfotelmatobacter sp.]|nr:GH25 family lysozyme [Candidatus Sulfotelmatobacter sp.]
MTKTGAQSRPLGCDVSNHQPIGLNWTTTVKGNGMSFAWAKATEGETYTDPNFTTYVANAKAAGVLIGAYHFAHPETHLGLAGADGEAAQFWSVAGKYITNGGVYIMPALDMETDVGTNNPVVYTSYTLSQWANRWCQDIANDAASNGVAVKPVIYTFTSYSSEWFNSSVTNWPLWIASWPNNPNPQSGAPSSNGAWPTWTFWQWADTNVTGGDSDTYNTNQTPISSMVIGSSYPPFFETPLVNSRAVDAGKSVKFSAQVDGSLPLVFQWRFNGTNLPNATNSTLLITSTTTNNAGNYALVATNAAGAITSSVVSLIVYPLQTTVFSDNFDVNTATNWTLNASSSDTAATFNYDYSAVGIPSAPNSTNGTTRGLRMQANLANGVVAALSLSPTNRSFSGDYRVHFDAWINVNGPLPGGGAGSTLFLTGGLGTSGTRTEWNGSGSTADGFYFACDGDGGVSPSLTGINDYTVLTGTTLQGSSSGYYLAGTDSTARGFANLYYQSAITNSHAPPTLQQEDYPSQSTNALDPGKFGFAWHDVLVSKRGSTVDWVIDGIRFAVISNATFTASNVFVGHWDGFASLSANNAINFSLVDNVRVEQPAAPPQFTLQPIAQTVTLGTNVTFTAATTGLPAANYQWQFNSTNILGATNSSYALAFVAQTNAGNYSVIATNIAGSVTSTNAALALVSPDAAQFTSISLQGGALQVGFGGDPYWTYTVEVSTNLTDWSALTNMVSTNGVFNFTAAVTNAPQEFFRARVGP